MKRIFSALLVSAIFSIFAFSLNAQLLTMSGTASGTDNGPTTVSITLAGAPANTVITNVQAVISIGTYCPSWYWMNLNLAGVTTVTNLCNGTYNYSNLNGMAVNGTTITLSSVDADAYGDGVTLNMTLNVSYVVNAPMTYTSSTTTQTVTTKVPQGALEQQMLGMQIVTDGNSPAMTVSSMTFNTNGTTNTAAISNAKVYYTGTSNAYAKTNQFGTAVANPNGTFTITPATATTLSYGTNYFWLAYDVAPTAPAGTILDAECTSIVAGGIARTPSITAPVGSRTVGAPLAGNYTVGTGGNFATIKDAFDEIAILGLGGNTNLNIISNQTLTAPAVLNQWNEVGAGSYTLSIQPDGTTMRTISGNFTGSLIHILAADRVNIDGRFSNSGRYLTFMNQFVGAGNVIDIAGNGINGNTNITVRNSVIVGGSNTNSSCNAIIVRDNAGSTSYTSSASNINFIDNSIYNAYYGIRVLGTSPGVSGLNIERNSIGNTLLAQTVQYRGIVVEGCNSPLIVNNQLFDLRTTSNTNVTAIEISGTTPNATITGNIIRGVENSNSGGWGAYAINIVSSGVTNALIANNMISDVTTMNYSSSSTTYNGFGLRITSGTGHKIYNNTINLGSFTPNVGSSASMNAALCITSTSVTGLDVRNNLFVNTTTHNIAGSKSYSIYVPSSYTGFATLENNHYYVGGSFGVFGYNGSDVASLAAWKTATGKDNGSTFGLVSFIAHNNPLINGESIADPNLIKPTFTGAPATDIHNETRMANTNFAGADIVDPMVAITQDITLNPNLLGYCANTNLDMTFKPTLSGYADGVARTSPANPFVVTWYKNGNVITNNEKYAVNGTTLSLFLMNENLVADNYHATAVFMGKQLTTTVKPLKVDPELDLRNEIAHDFDPMWLDQYTVVEMEAKLLNSAMLPYVRSYTWQYSTDGSTWNSLDPILYPSSNRPLFKINGVMPNENTGYYRCVIYIESNCGNLNVYTEPLKFKVWYKFDIKSQPKSLVLCDTEKEANFGVVASGDIHSYQWFKDGEMIDPALNPTATTSFLKVSNLKYENSGTYTCRIELSDAKGPNRYEFTEDAELYVMKGTFISKDPENLAVKLGGTARFAVEAHHKGITPPFYKDKFQWFRFNASTNKSTPVADNNRISGSQSSVLSIRNVEVADFAHTGDYYYVVIEGQCGSATSGKAELTERLAETLAITAQPVAATACAGTTATMEVEAEASDMAAMLSYQWYLDGGKINDDANYSGTASSKLEIKDIAIYHAGSYTCEVKWNAEGLTEMSAGADLTVNNKPEITTQPDAVVNLQVGRDLELTVVATGANSYQWYKDGVELTGEMAATYSKQGVAITDGGTYTVKIINDCGDVMSQDAVVTITTGGHTSVVETENGIKLYAVNPNPTKDMGEIRFELTNSSNAKLSLMDAAGREVATLFAGVATAGTNSVRFDVNALGLTSGTYFVTLTSGETRLTTKLMIVK